MIVHGLTNQSRTTQNASDDEKISLASNALSDNEECGNLRSYTFLLGKNGNEFRLQLPPEDTDTNELTLR